MADERRQQVNRLRSRLLYYYCAAKSKTGGVMTMARTRATRLLDLTEAEEQDFLTTCGDLSTPVCVVRVNGNGLRIIRAEAVNGDDCLDVYRYWKNLSPLRGPKFTPLRRAKVATRLSDGYTVDQLKLAVDGCFASRWHKAQGYTDLELICRSGDKVEQFILLADQAQAMKDGRARNAGLTLPDSMKGLTDEDV